MLKKKISYGHQFIDGDDRMAVDSVLRSDFITQGPKVKGFEEALCRYTGARYAVAVANGTAALHIAALAADIKNGDEVVTSPITFIASSNCVLYCAGSPVFADVQDDTVNIDPAQVLKKITRKTKAIIPVHFGGHPCDMEAIYKIARKRGLLIIEDAAHALGAEYKGKKIGSCKYSDMAIFSFHPVKSITTGEGGAVMTNDKALYERLLILRNHGVTKDASRLVNKAHGPWYYEMQELGFNYRLTDIQSGLGLSQLKKLDRFVNARREIAKQYDMAFEGNPFFEVPFEAGYARSAYHLYPIRIKDEFLAKRKGVFMNMTDRGLGVQVHYIPVYLQPYYKRSGYKNVSCLIAERYYKGAISIPIYPALKKDEIAYVIENVLGSFEECCLK